MEYEMKLRAVYFEKIRSGQKVYEIRLNDEKRQLLKVGDVIIFRKEENLEETLRARVVDLIYFESFEAMVGALGTREIGFGDSAAGEVVDVYRGFYSVEDERKFGVVAIKVEVETSAGGA